MDDKEIEKIKELKSSFEDEFKDFFANQDKLYGTDGEVASQHFSILKKITVQGALEDDFHLTDVLNIHHRDAFYATVGKFIKNFFSTYGEQLKAKWSTSKSFDALYSWVESDALPLTGDQAIEFLSTPELRWLAKKSNNEPKYMTMYADLPEKWSFFDEIIVSLNGALKILIEKEESARSEKTPGLFLLAMDMIDRGIYNQESKGLFDKIYCLRKKTTEEVRVSRKIDEFIARNNPTAGALIEKLLNWMLCAKIEQKQIIEDRLALIFGLAAEQVISSAGQNDALFFEKLDALLRNRGVEDLWCNRYLGESLTTALVIERQGKQIYQKWWALHTQSSVSSKPISNSNEAHSPESKNFKPTPPAPEDILLSASISSPIEPGKIPNSSSPAVVLSFSNPPAALTNAESLSNSRALEA